MSRDPSDLDRVPLSGEKWEWDSGQAQLVNPDGEVVSPSLADPDAAAEAGDPLDEEPPAPPPGGWPPPDEAAYGDG